MIIDVVASSSSGIGLFYYHDHRRRRRRRLDPQHYLHSATITAVMFEWLEDNELMIFHITGPIGHFERSDGQFLVDHCE
jgi:hypothetical protein